MKPAGLRSAVAARDAAERESGRRATLEASGGVSLSTVAGSRTTGVDYISVGALTHSAPALDLSLLLDPRLALPHLSRRERRRSLSTRPPVCSSGQ